ncbi:MAG: TfoX/Sxy family protein [Gemmatimonadaceae bacterium]
MQLGKRAGLTEKRMFGGLAFLLHGNMCVGIHGLELIVRLDPGATDAALAKRHTRRFDLTGRPMAGWILVEPKGTMSDTTLGSWVWMGVDYAESLPRK